MADFKLEMSTTSFFRKTQLLTKGGSVFFGLWRVPTIYLDGDEKKVRVTERDRGRLDGIAFREYGDRTLFPAIQIVNKIDHVPSHVKPGMVLVIPKRARIDQALQEVSEGVSGGG